MKKSISAIIAIIIAFVFCLPAFANETQTLPSAYSAVEKGYVTQPKQQGYSGCCWAFAAVSCLESDAIMKGYETNPDFSEAHLVWSVFSASNIDTDVNKEEKAVISGASMYQSSGDYGSVINAIAKGCGINNETSYPFYPFNVSKMGNYSSDSYYSNNGYTIENAAFLSSDEETKEWILEHGGVAALIYAGEGAQYSKTSSTTAYYNGPVCKKPVNHGIAIVGWDDNYSKYNFRTVPEHNGAWLCKNSWGSDWGNKGYFWLSYDEPSFSNVYGFSVKRAEYDKVYTYNGVTYSSMVALSNNLSYSNIFGVSEDEELKSISFYTFEHNSANIRVVELNDNYSSPDDGVTIYNSPFLYVDNGYQTASIPNVKLTAGKFYSVIIELSGERCVCVAEAGAESYCKYTVSNGQSFLKYNNAWHDCYKNGNVYINMYTVKADKNIKTEQVVQESPVTNEDGTDNDNFAQKDNGMTEKMTDTASTENNNNTDNGSEVKDNFNFWARVISFFAVIASVLSSVFKIIASFF